MVKQLTLPFSEKESETLSPKEFEKEMERLDVLEKKNPKAWRREVFGERWPNVKY